MPSVFPGMDPFIEGDDWEDFHSNLISEIQAILVPGLRPDYVVRTERRVYVEHPSGDSIQIRPDVAVLRNPRSFDSSSSLGGTVTLANIEPVERTLPSPPSMEEKYLIIRRLDSSEVVTIIEVLSPTNKKLGAVGRETYLSKREEILQSRTHLIEIDLQRGGERLPTVEPLPTGDYFAFVCRANRRFKAAVYAWPLNHRLPKIPIPLSANDPDVELDLQSAMDNVYDRAGYDYSLNYSRTPDEPFSEAEQKWVESLLPRKS